MIGIMTPFITQGTNVFNMDVTTTSSDVAMLKSSLVTTSSTVDRTISNEGVATEETSMAFTVESYSYNFTDDLFNETTSIVASTKSSHMDPEEVDRYLWIYWSPITFLIGILGNIAILLVIRHFYRHGGREKSSTTLAISVYFAFMAVADIVFIVSGIVPEWLEAMEIIIISEVHPIMCKFEKFIFYTSGDIAIWIICIFNVDRFIHVCFPLKQNCQCVRRCLRHPVLLSSIISIAACLKNIHVFWTRGYVKDGDYESNCGRPKPFAHFEEYIRPWIAFFLVSLVPSIVIIICNVSIIVTLRRARKMRAETHTTSSDSGFMQTIFMCMSASIAFLLFVTPSMVIYIGRAYWTDPDEPEENPYSYDIAKAVNNQLVYVNHSINFFLYCITGKRFRETFKAVMTCKSVQKIFEERRRTMYAEYRRRIGKTSTVSNGNHRVSQGAVSPSRNSKSHDVSSHTTHTTANGGSISANKPSNGHVVSEGETEQNVKNNSVDTISASLNENCNGQQVINSNLENSSNNNIHVPGEPLDPNEIIISSYSEV